jgi:hypothetical protein
MMEFSVILHEQRPRLSFQLLLIVALNLSVLNKMFEYLQ